ncbi:MAG TPA: serine hydrolase [Symbiobacteriaceae bacterium]|nr:serine hydrolase [Symbiobacteriaceae bacterium]
MRRRLALLIAAASLVAGCFGAGGQVPDPQTAAASAAKSMLLSGPPALARNASAPDMRTLRKQLQEYLAEQDGTYGVYVLDLASGRGVGINSDKVFPAASTFKLPMVLYILDLVAQGKATLDEAVTYAPSDWEEGTGTLQDWIGVGDRLQVRELIELAITQSDNIATQMLLRRFGVQNVYEYMHRLGGQVTHYDDGVIGTTPREMAAYMRQAQANLIRDPGLKAFLLEALENTAFADRTAAGVPQGVAVAHKIGTLPNVVNDIALVEAPGHPFIIAAFSVGVDDEVAPSVITEVTRKVYDFLISG